MRIFNDKDLYRKLYRACLSWKGVPYLHMGNNRHGIDCTKMVAQIFVEIGLIEKVDPVIFPRDWYQHTKEEKAIDEFVRHVKEYKKNPYVYDEVHEEDYFPGDIIFFRMNPNSPANHCAIYLEGNIMFHCIDGVGCCFVPVGYYWIKRIAKVFTLKGAEQWGWG